MRITLFDFDRQQETQIETTPSLGGLLSYAHQWVLQGDPDDRFTLSFPSMLAAFVAGDDPLCAWLRQHLALRGARVDNMIKGRRVPAGALPPRLTTTSSFRQALTEARSLAADSLLDVR